MSVCANAYTGQRSIYTVEKLIWMDSFHCNCGFKTIEELIKTLMWPLGQLQTRYEKVISAFADNSFRNTTLNLT